MKGFKELEIGRKVAGVLGQQLFVGFSKGLRIMMVKVGKSLRNLRFLIDEGKRLVWRQNKEENSSFELLFWAVISNPRSCLCA